MANIKQETISGVKWGILQKIVLQPLQLVYSMILARLITPEEMGIVGLTAIFFAVATQLSNAGFGAALIRKLDRNEEDCSTMFWFNLGMSLLSSLILFLLAPWFADFYQQTELLWLTRASAVMMFLSSTSSIHWTLYQCRRDFKTPAIIQSVSAIAGMPVCLILACMGWGVWALMWSNIFSTLLTLTLIWIISPWKPHFIFSSRSFTELFSFGSKLAISGVLHVIYLELRTFIIGKFYSPAQLGLYSRGRHLAILVPSSLESILNNVTYPVLSSVKDNNEKLSSAYRKYIRISTLVIAWCAFIVIALAAPTVELFYGATWLPCVPFLQIISLASAVSHLNGINLELLKVKGRSDLFLKLEVLKKSVSIGMIIYAATISVEAICWATVIYCFSVIALNSYFTGKILKLTWRRQIQDCIPYVSLAALSAIPAYLCTLISIPPLFQLVAGGSVSTLLYFGTLHIIREKAYTELFNTIKASPLVKFLPRFIHL